MLHIKYPFGHVFILRAAAGQSRHQKGDAKGRGGWFASKEKAVDAPREVRGVKTAYKTYNAARVKLAKRERLLKKKGIDPATDETAQALLKSREAAKADLSDAQDKAKGAGFNVNNKGVWRNQKEFEAAQAGGAGRERYTESYWDNQEALQELDAVVKMAGADAEPSLLALRHDVSDTLTRERKLSDLAQSYGYKPNAMAESDWLELSTKLEDQIGDELSGSTAARRAAKGGKLRGTKRELGMVGGQERWVRAGAYSAKDAAKLESKLTWSTKDDADEYMAGKLTELGYKPRLLAKTDYNQKRRLLAEAGHGALQYGKIGGITRQEREAVVKRLTESQAQDALSNARNPRTAKGLDTWTLYAEASARGGKPDVSYIPDELYGGADDERKPAYVEKPQGKIIRPKLIIDETEAPF